MAMLDAAAVSYRLVLTKSDKVKASELAETTAKVKAEARTHGAAHPQILATSSEKGGGIAELRASAISAPLQVGVPTRHSCLLQTDVGHRVGNTSLIGQSSLAMIDRKSTRLNSSH